MKIKITRKFKRQIDHCDDKHIRKKVAAVIDAIRNSRSIKSIPNTRKLKGFKNCYRIRIGDYRIGILIDHDSAVFAAFDHRSDIYKYFP